MVVTFIIGGLVGTNSGLLGHILEWSTLKTALVAGAASLALNTTLLLTGIVQ